MVDWNNSIIIVMKTALVTGSNRGLGRGFVEYLTDQGVKVFAGARKPESFDKELASHPKVRVIPLDVASDASIKKAARLVKAETDHLDYLINNAGLNKDSATNGRKEKVSQLKSLDRKTLLKMFEVNSIGPIMMVKEFMDWLSKGRSFVINVSSCRASYNDEYPNSSGNYGYRASKIALNMMTFCSRHDLPKKVKTFAVHPGGVKTDMNPGGTDDAYEQARKIIGITRNWKEKFNGRFLRYNGVFYP
jgi:NAD(P)-dependent dehydrogenase (short-subunit alcohol dehydrogenase family)